MKKKTAPPCNEDCFNCKYNDCILDGLGRGKAPAPPKELSMDPRNIRRREHWRQNADRLNAQKRARYAAHREEICAKRRKPPKPDKVDYKGLCGSCIHFVQRKRGKKGGLWEMCDKSSKDCREFAEWGFLRPVGFRNKCSRYEEAK